MAEQKVLYMTPAELKSIDRSKIKCMTMITGDIFLISHDNKNVQIEQNAQNEESNQIKFRARNEVKTEEEKEEEKPEEKQGEVKEVKKEEKEEEVKEEKAEENKEEKKEEKKSK